VKFEKASQPLAECCAESKNCFSRTPVNITHPQKDKDFQLNPPMPTLRLRLHSSHKVSISSQLGNSARIFITAYSGIIIEESG
jgi:hypothetical protein